MTESRIDFVRYGSAIIAVLLGEPNHAMSKGDEKRWGSGGSFSYRQSKATWFDHESGEGGGIVDLMRRERGEGWREWLLGAGILDRQDADELSRGSGRRRGNGNGSSSQDDDAYAHNLGERDYGAPDDDDRGGGRPAPILGVDGKPLSNKPRTTREYDYTDRYGAMIYQVVRQEWLKDGSKRKKFFQRRRTAGGGWANNLDGIDHQLYRLPDLAEAAPGQDLVFVCEGEKDVETLIAAGLIATTNSGGAKTWTEEHAKALAGQDVVVLVDNDDAGRARLSKIGPSLIRHCRAVKALDLAEFWADISEKDDVTDWFERGGGTAIDLERIGRQLPSWRPMPPPSKFGAMRIADVLKPGPEHEFLVKGVITRGEVSMLVGPSGSGKSFLASDLSLSIARGVDFVGRRTMRGGVLYIAGEGGRGLKKRLRAYIQHHNLDVAKDDIPFVLLTLPVDLHSSDKDMDALIAEVVAHAATFTVPLELVVIDTLSAATPGANENASEDMTRVLARIGKIKDAVNSAVMLVHHMNAAGTKARGHSSIFANVDSVIEVTRSEDVDSAKRAVRKAKLTKQKDGDDGTSWDFVLKRVVLSVDQDGDEVTSCVCVPRDDQPAEQQQMKFREDEPQRGKKDWGERLTGDDFLAMKAMDAAVKKHGRLPPPTVECPPWVQIVVNMTDWRDEYMRLDQKEDESAAEHIARIKKRRDRVTPKLMERGFVGRDGQWFWRTKKRVLGIDRPEIVGGAEGQAAPAPLVIDGHELGPEALPF